MSNQETKNEGVSVQCKDPPINEERSHSKNGDKNKNNVNLQRDNETFTSVENHGIPKSENARKKGKSRNMHLEMPGAGASTRQCHVRTQGNGGPQNGFLTVQELLLHQVRPMYAPNSKYLENLSRLPQYQYVQNNLVNPFQTPNQYAPGSLPNSPLAHMNGMCQGWSTPNSPISADPASPRYLQNVMQHPLLNQSYATHNNFHQRQERRPQPSNVDTKKNNNKKKDDECKHFEPHLSKEEVEAGLKENTFIEGVVRINPKQFQHSYISSSDRSEQDIFIDGIRNRNRALEGDVVVVQLINQAEESNSEDVKQKKGKVVFIKEMVHTRTCIGTLKLMPDKNRMRALFVPRDYRIPRLNIRYTNWPDNFYAEAKSYENTLFLAKIDRWDDTRFAVGQIICNIGQSGDMEAETKAILAQTDLDVTPFGPEVRELYPPSDYVIPESEIQRREDCRKLCIFSIDPSNCRDIDDALSCVELKNGNYEIGVHISDVAHYLTEDTILDKKVSEKATTIYLVQKAYHMLPNDLCMLCSLFPGVDRLAFSVFWEITPDAHVVRHRFTKTVIHSCCQLSYDQVQEVLDDKLDAEACFPEFYNGYRYADVYKTIKILGKLSSILRTQRVENGALCIYQPKVAFHLNPSSSLPDDIWIYESKPSHQLIEEFMLLANMTVAKKIYEDHPTLAFLRCHPPPSGYMLQQLAKALKPMGINLDVSSSGNLYKSMMLYIGPGNTNKGQAMVLSMLCAKPMARAKYFCASGCHDDEFHHYALNVPLYTHFTSPIRRYADIMVHRLLSASLGYQEVPKWDVTNVQKIAAQCNKQKYNSKRASELSTELYTLKYIEMNSPFMAEAVVVDVREKYIDVIIIAMGLNRRIFFNSDFPGEHKCIKNDAGVKLSKMELVWKSKDSSPDIKQVIEVFSIVKVELNKDEEMSKVDTKLVNPV